MAAIMASKREPDDRMRFFPYALVIAASLGRNLSASFYQSFGNFHYLPTLSRLRLIPN
jgi:hypothetical protein